MSSSPPSPPQEPQTQSESTIDQPFFSPILDAPYYWHVDADKNKSHSAHQFSSSSKTSKDGTVPSNVDRNGSAGDIKDILKEEEEEMEMEKDSEKIGSMNPVFVIPWGVAEKARRYFERIVGFGT